LGALDPLGFGVVLADRVNTVKPSIRVVATGRVVA
jgi:hypothetical protein